jgi:phycocyanobilin:ferredoxin oxidoreductase
MTAVSEPTIASLLPSSIARLASTILDVWSTRLHLFPFALPEGAGYVEGRLEGERLVIENRCYQTSRFRKMHLELAKVGDGLDILHCVMFPRPEYPLPMFGCDIVAGKGRIGAAIVDLSPTTPERTLSSEYRRALENLPALSFSRPRDLPSWGGIFSEFCLFIRPDSPGEESLFQKRVKEYLTIHCKYAGESQPVSPENVRLYLDGQRHYCLEQRKNDKTLRVLEKAFGADWAARYMTEVLFDLPSLPG